MNEFFKRLISKPVTMERFNLDNFQDLGDVKIVIKETDGILQKGIHILCHKNWVESIFKNLELLRLKYIQTNEDKYLDAILGVLPNSFKDFTFENQLRLQAENQELKKNVLVWHKVADGDYPPCERGNYTINVLTDCGDIAYYNYDDDCWVVDPSSAEIDPPVAWCEIPKYEGKK